MTIGREPMCMQCKHFHFDNTTSITCNAFPRGIPENIFIYHRDHQKPYRGDGGIRFEPLEEK